MKSIDELIRLETSLILSIGWFKPFVFRDIRYHAKRDIVDNLNKAGRSRQPIGWIEGGYEFGKEFPLIHIHSQPEHYRIIGYCYVPKSMVNEEFLNSFTDSFVGSFELV